MKLKNTGQENADIIIPKSGVLDMFCLQGYLGWLMKLQRNSWDTGFSNTKINISRVETTCVI